MVPEESLPDGTGDATTVSRLMRFAAVPNLSGHPAITFPFGYDNNNLPIAGRCL
jgi:Asp-tRNA(Asn)/Glu-tRNA(Gln) amidotransferase A subunit family amidase